MESSTQQLATRIDAGLHKKAKLAALQDEKTLQQFISEAIAEKLSRRREERA